MPFNSLLSPALQGFALGASFLLVIGAQNAFVLRQGLQRSHPFATALFCSLADALLITLGVGGFGQLIQSSPLALKVIGWGGGVFLCLYGLKCLWRAFKPQQMEAKESGSESLTGILAQAFAFTFLNPHVYLDVVVLLGGLSARFKGSEKLAYGVGAASASFIWFFALAYGARFLAPLFKKPLAWQVLDILISLAMFSIAYGLIKPMIG